VKAASIQATFRIDSPANRWAASQARTGSTIVARNVRTAPTGLKPYTLLRTAPIMISVQPGTNQWRKMIIGLDAVPDGTKRIKLAKTMSFEK
jgi:hypothetical protein